MLNAQRAQTVSAQGPGGQGPGGEGPGGHGHGENGEYGAAALPPELQFLSSLPPDQRFDHVTSIQMSFVNPQGTQVVLSGIPGTVTAVTGTSISLQPNGAAAGTPARTFNVTPSTFVHGKAQRGSLSVFKAGDKAVVYVINNSTNAVAVVEPRLALPALVMLTGHPGMMMHRGAGTPTPAAGTPAPGTPAPATATPGTPAPPAPPAP
jgi:hypothetical protein